MLESQNKTELIITQEVPQRVFGDEGKRVYYPSNQEHHPGRQNVTDPDQEKVLNTLTDNQYYSVAILDPIGKAASGEKGEVLTNELADTFYFKGNHLKDIVSTALANPNNTLELSIFSHKQHITEKEWNAIEHIVGPLTSHEANLLANNQVVTVLLDGTDQNIAYRSGIGLIKTNYPAYDDITQTIDQLRNLTSEKPSLHPSLTDLSNEKRQGIIEALSSLSTPSIEELKKGVPQINDIPKPLFTYAIGISELNSLQLEKNNLTPFQRPVSVDAQSASALQPLRDEISGIISDIKPEKNYRIFAYFDPAVDILPIHKQEGNRLLSQIEQDYTARYEGKFISGKVLGTVLTEQLQQDKQTLGGHFIKPHIEVNQYAFTITPKLEAAIEKATGKLTDVELHELAKGNSIVKDQNSFKLGNKDGIYVLVKETVPKPQNASLSPYLQNILTKATEKYEASKPLQNTVNTGKPNRPEVKTMNGQPKNQAKADRTDSTKTKHQEANKPNRNAKKSRRQG